MLKAIAEQQYLITCSISIFFLRSSCDWNWTYSMNLGYICFRLLEMFFTCLRLPRSQSLNYFLFSACPPVSRRCLLSELTLEEFVITRKDTSYGVECCKDWDNWNMERMSLELWGMWGQEQLETYIWSKRLIHSGRTCTVWMVYKFCNLGTGTLQWVHLLYFLVNPSSCPSQHLLQCF